MLARFDFGKIDYHGTGKRYPCYVEVCLEERGGTPTYTLGPNKERQYTGEKTPSYLEFTASGWIMNPAGTDYVLGGQCLDTIAQYVDDPVFREIYAIWKRWHLNGMNAGTPEQEDEVRKWITDGHKYDYDSACAYLAEIGLLTVPFHGVSAGRMYNGELYTYGHGWIVNELPQDVVDRVREMMLSTKCQKILPKT